ncbi:MAG TPA: hypothetical protein VE397_20955, partial [Stellaceae bacterium]|nr:hypothetical protein [Stellaceae bacterium]
GAEAVVQQARRLERAPRRDMSVVESQTANEEPPWSRRSRLFFILGAATLCWAVPGAIIYWLVR